MANITAQLPAESDAPPESACPEVQPRARRAPYANRIPPQKANIQRPRLEMFGPLVVSSLARPWMIPETKPPTRVPSVTNTIQSSRGFFRTLLRHPCSRHPCRRRSRRGHEQLRSLDSLCKCRLSRSLFDLIPAHHHGFDPHQRGGAGGGQVNVHHDESRKQPGYQGVERRQEGQPAQAVGQVRPALCAPHQCACDDLQRQQYVQNAKIRRLLQGIQFLLRCLLEGVRLASKDAAQVEQGLRYGLFEDRKNTRLNSNHSY